MTGVILWGVNNIYTVLAEHAEYRCRIRGKVLRDISGSYNPLAPGDCVEFDIETVDSGMIYARLERRNAFQRWNRKRNAPQTVAANLDTLFCLTCPDNPPFRPRFIDRALVTALRSEIPFVLIVNKSDLPIPEAMRERLDVYTSMDVPVLYCSADTGAGMTAVSEAVAGRRCAFVGQSGVGKSTLLNRLDPGFPRRTGEVSRKYNRGAHTTVYAVMSVLDDGTGLIDTPGIREIEVFDLEPHDLSFYFPDLHVFREQCAFATCMHQNEPGCAVHAALEKGLIHPDRYESYLRILDSLDGSMVG